MELTERTDLRSIHYLNSLTYDNFKTYMKCSATEAEKKQKYDNLKQFCKTNIKARGEVKRIYSYSLKTPLESGGRLFCGGSVQGLPKDTRGLVMSHTTDIDMKNAHPKILLYLCKKHNLMAPNLTYYCENRDAIFETMDGDKEVNKTLFLKSLNDEKLNRKEKNVFFKAFDKEMKDLQKKLSEIGDYRELTLSVPAHKLYNWYGSAINRIMCSFENKILQTVISVLNRKGMEIAVLMFDGLMVYGDHYNNAELLKEIEDAVNADFDGLKMEFAYKAHSTAIQIPTDFDADKEADEEFENINSFAKVAAAFEENHAKIINANVFIKEGADGVMSLSRQHLKTAYEHMIYEKVINSQGKSMVVSANFINDWLVNNPEQRCYESMEIYPTGLSCPSNHYNMWRPFEMEFVTEYVPQPDGCEKMLNHIKILCGHEEAVYDYFIKWIAQMIQYPAVKTIIPTLISNEGAGKGTLMRLLEKMLGGKKVLETTTPSRDVWGDFNGIMADAFLVNLNELSKKEMIECEGQFKGLITDPTIWINNKGVNQFKVQSYHRFITTTNNEEPLNTKKGDRRNLMIRSSDEKCGDKEYFTEMYALLDDVNVVKTCYEYFKAIPDMDKFGKIPLPVTDYQQDLQELSKSPIENWVKSFTYDNMDKSEVTVFTKEAFTEFKHYITENKVEYHVNNVQFGVRLQRLKIDGITTGIHSKKGYKIKFDINILKKKFQIGCQVDMNNEEGDDDTELFEDDEDDEAIATYLG